MNITDNYPRCNYQMGHAPDCPISQENMHKRKDKRPKTYREIIAGMPEKIDSIQRMLQLLQQSQQLVSEHQGRLDLHTEQIERLSERIDELERAERNRQ